MFSELQGSFEWFPLFSGNRLRRQLGTREIAEMARIPPVDLHCAFYLYPDEESARAGLQVGGSGFWVAIPSERVKNFHWFYAVSNRHVVHNQGASVIRANLTDGTLGVISADPTEWIEHPAGHDIAVLPVNMATMRGISFTAVPITSFVARSNLNADGLVGVGDDVYMIGRFINHEGKAKNAPSARFGNISMLPDEPIYIDEKTVPQESFVVELRSMCGYSGSPVFVELSGWKRRDDGLKMRWEEDALLGVHWGISLTRLGR